MNEAQKLELQELTNLEGAGTLEESQKSRLELLRLAEQAEKTATEKSKDLESALAQKEHYREKHEKAEADRIALEKKLNDPAVTVPPVATKTLEVEDFIGISASLEGLDHREKEYLAEQHKLTGRPLKDIRVDENFLLWQTAYKQKVEKERALIPDGAQLEGDAPRTLSSRLQELNNSNNHKANLAEQEKLLQEAGLYKAPRQNPHRQSIS